MNSIPEQWIPARYITFEGLDGSGKTTQIQLFENWLKKENIPYILTREPGGTPLGERIRHMILVESVEIPTPRSELLLYLADRAQHLERVVLPALRKGLWVVSDRGVDSTLAYQGSGRGFGIDMLVELHRMLELWFPPHLTIWVDIDPDEGLRRKEQSGRTDWNRLENETMDFHHRVHEGYQELYRRFPERILRIQGADDPISIHRRIVAEVTRRFRGKEI